MFQPKVALITGSSRGIGRAIAMRFAAAGYQLVLTGRDREKLEETAALVSAAGGLQPKIVVAELRETHGISRLVGSTLENYGKIDVLVNNAGVMHLKPFLEITTDEINEMMETNFTAVFQLTQRVVPAMIARNSGTIINIGSIASKRGFSGGAGYCASKFALRGFAQSLMLELRQHGIRLITILPGSVNTDMLSDNPAGASAESALHPEDVAHAVFAAAESDSRATISELEIRPSNPQKR